LFEGVDARAITIQREQYGGTIHLFIGMGRSSSENIFMTLICIHNRNINHQGLIGLFLFGSVSYLTFVATLSRSCRLLAIASTFVVIVFRKCLRLNDLLRGKRYSSRSISYDEGPVIFNNTLETKRLVVSLRTFERGRPPIEMKEENKTMSSTSNELKASLKDAKEKYEKLNQTNRELNDMLVKIKED
jgi:hypothetical protein